MAIVSSTYTVGGAQIDGRHYVREDHVDNLGAHWVLEYLADVGTDYSAVMAARVAGLWDRIVDGDCAQVLSESRPMVIYATKTQLANAFKVAFKNATKVEAARLATWLLNRIDDATWTEAQVYNALGYTSNQWTNTVKPRLEGYRTAYNAVISATGG